MKELNRYVLKRDSQVRFNNQIRKKNDTNDRAPAAEVAVARKVDILTPGFKIEMAPTNNGSLSGGSSNPRKMPQILFRRLKASFSSLLVDAASTHSEINFIES